MVSRVEIAKAEEIWEETINTVEVDTVAEEVDMVVEAAIMKRQNTRPNMLLVFMQ
jgi:hypothetical protein